MNSFQFPTIRNQSKSSKPASSSLPSILPTKYKLTPASPYFAHLSSFDSSKNSKLHIHIDPNTNSKDPSSPSTSSANPSTSPYSSPVSKPPHRNSINPTPMQSNPLNSGPFSPNNIFTTRRIWIKRVGGTPTTLLVHQNDIIDDVKQAVIAKFPNSLARMYDPADIMIKMDLQARQPLNLQHSNNNPGPAVKQQSIATKSLQSPALTKPEVHQPVPISQGKKPSISNPSNRLLLISPDTASRSPASPLGITHTIPAQVNQNQVNSYSLINLEPDQNVWQLLDLYYSQGMTLQEALIVDTPEFPELVHELAQNQAAVHGLARTFSSNRLNQQQQQYNPYQQQHQQYNPYLQQQQQQYNSYQHQPPIIENSGTPNSYNGGQYYQPKPQYSYQNNPDFGQQNSPNYAAQDRSTSPFNVNRVRSPNRAVQLHRRSFSNPPQSPVGNSSHNLPKGNNSNGQAILLLPKNFSLASTNHKQGGGSNDPVSSVYENEAKNSKRLSLDEGFVRKNRVEGQDHGNIKSASGSNLTNIGIGINSPPDPSGHPLPTSKSSEVIANDDSNSTLTSKNIGSLSISPSPPPNVNQQLNSPTREDDSSMHASNSVDSILSKREKKPPTKPPTNKDSKNEIHRKPEMSTVKPKTTTDKVLPSISVLVVEDNAINQAILGAFLRKHKIHYQIAKNGQDAIDKWRKGGFHLVLMDIQLPVKSGIEATKEIRYLEKINRIGVFAQNELASDKFKAPSELKEDQKLDLNVFRSPVIIVALTASSNSSVDRKNALTAGCNDYLTKPVNLVWLQNKITEWGCMQALIDFDGWRIKGSNNSNTTRTLTKDQKSDMFKNSLKTLITN